MKPVVVVLLISPPWSVCLTRSKMASSRVGVKSGVCHSGTTSYAFRFSMIARKIAGRLFGISLSIP
jgi:hypothetical protein